MDSNIEDIKRSYGRSLVSHGSKKKFFVRFYEVFLASDPEIRSRFMQVNIAKQVDALRNGISMVILHAENKDKLAGDVLDGIRKTHSTENLNIKAEHYKFWEESLITVLKEYDAEFNDKLEKEWRELIQQTVDYMLGKH